MFFRKDHLHDLKKYTPAIIATMLLVVVYYLGLSQFNSISLFFDIRNAEQISQKTEAYFQKDAGNLLLIARDMSKNQELNEAVKAKDILFVSDFVKKERIMEKLDELVVTNENGLVLARGNATNYTGDYIFETTGWGRAFTKQDEVKGVGVGAVWPLIVVGGKQLTDSSGNFLGVVLPVYVLNNNYSDRFKTTFNNDIAFYSRKFGIVGDSFGNNRISRELTSYFSPSPISELKDKSVLYAKINNRNYFIYISALRGLDDRAGNFLLFIPGSGDNLNILWSISIAVMIYICFYLLHIFGLFAPTKSMKKKHAILLGIIFSAVITFPVTFFINQTYLSERYINISEPVNTIYNSTLSISPAFGIFDKKSEQKIKIVVTTGGETINLIQTVVDYNPKVINVTDVNLEDSFCAKGLLIEQDIDNNKGQVKISCIVMSPGFLGAPATVATLSIQPKKVGNAEFRFGEDSVVLANDGLGSDVLRQSAGASYKIKDSFGLSSTSPFIVFSFTHPNSTAWYNASVAEFDWQGSPNAVFSYSLTATTSLLAEFSTTTNREVSLPVSEGVHFFHVREMVGGKVIDEISYPIQVDFTPPEKPVIELSSSIVKPNELLRASFSSRDATSGLQKNFYVSYDRGIFFPLKPPLAISFSEPGEHSVTIRVFDNAGNFSDNTAYINVSP